MFDRPYMNDSHISDGQRIVLSGLLFATLEELLYTVATKMSELTSLNKRMNVGPCMYECMCI